MIGIGISDAELERYVKSMVNTPDFEGYFNKLKSGGERALAERITSAPQFLRLTKKGARGFILALTEDLKTVTVSLYNPDTQQVKYSLASYPLKGVYNGLESSETYSKEVKADVKVNTPEATKASEGASKTPRKKRQYTKRKTTSTSPQTKKSSTVTANSNK